MPLPQKIITTPSRPSLVGLPSPDYVLIKPLGNDRFLLRRKADGLPLLGHYWAEYYQPSTSPVHELVQRGAGAAAAAVLNHENLVSLRGEVANFTPLEIKGRKLQAKQVLLLWDWCDGGSLEQFLDESYKELDTEALWDGGEFMPESFCWHVLTSVLRALQWLHQGVRETYGVVEVDEQEGGMGDGEGGGGGLVPHPGQRGRAGRIRVVNKTTLPVREGGKGGWKREGRNDDWFPVLHRDIRASKIFLQHPRGTETYGLVKLGDLRYCAVSGTVVSEGGDKKKKRLGLDKVPIVAPERMEELGRYKEEDGGAGLNGIGELRKRMVEWWKDAEKVEKKDRPYTAGNDLAAVGAILYHMMTGEKIVDFEECDVCGCVHVYDGGENDEEAEKIAGCTDGCPRLDIDVRRCFDDTGYTPGLKQVVGALLRCHRSVTMTASEAMDQAWKGYETWTRTTEDGQVYRDLYEDTLFRRQNLERIEGRVPEWTNNAAYNIRKEINSSLRF
ncbi:hypothetical protein QBC41DRAFT_393724 [Cercophora samala]|uniref:non-specific serine/threonine protein kinase n=1 Tax=Cercophora samala TaxID=330535 RepID=A0AA39ZCL1_9PEZI|nr:hypothetical protein QBC41DRAFT_393724 [Cercophora samala]